MAQKIGILGGTFNPIHTGHIKLAETALMQADLDKVIFMPSGKSYMKRNLYVLPGEERYRLIALSIEDFPQFQVSDLEIKRQGNTYTYETLEILQEQNPSREYYFILGADCLFSMENWVEPQRIFDACTVLAAVRNGKNRAELEKQALYLQEKFSAEIMLLDFEEIELSSSEIRQRIADNRSLNGLVPIKAAEYIAKQGFYK